MTTHVYYHADMDGYASGAIAASGLNRKYNVAKNEIQMHKIQYGDPFNPGGLIDYEKDQIVMVDFSLQNDDEMLDLLYKWRMIWIDHHQTSLDFLARHPDFLDEVDTNSIVVSNSQSASELTWRYFFKSEPPLLVKLVGAYDTWTKDGELDWYDQILPAHVQMMHMQEDIEPSTSTALAWWDWVFAEAYEATEQDLGSSHEHYTNQIITLGKKLVSFQESIYKDITSSAAYEATFCGQYKAICLNTPIYNSRVFEVAFDVSQYDLMVAYGFNGSKWRVSLYTVQDNVSCADLARKLGQEGPYKTGGGHPKAAGFITTYELLDSYIEIKEKL